MDQQAAAATVRSDFHQAQLQAETNEGLYKEGLIAGSDGEAVAGARRGARDAQRHRGEAGRDGGRRRQGADRRPAGQGRAARSPRRAEARRRRTPCTCAPGSRAFSGKLPVQVGQQVAPGSTLAKVAEPDEAEGRARDRRDPGQATSLIGQPASIDTRNGLVAGKVSRIDPAVLRTEPSPWTWPSRAAAPGRPAGPLRGRGDRARPAEGRALRRAAGVRPGEEPGRSLPPQRRRGRGGRAMQVRLGKSSVNTVEISRA